MQHENNRVTDIEFIPNDKIPFSHCALFVFETATYPEGILHIAEEGGILITYDSVKNWLSADQFFSPETAKLYEEQGFFGSASISKVWKQACNVNVSDFIKLTSFSFCHLLSAHGEPLLNDAYVRLTESVKQEFNL